MKNEKNLEFHRKKIGSRLYCLVNLILSTIETLRFFAIAIVYGILEESKNC